MQLPELPPDDEPPLDPPSSPADASSPVPLLLPLPLPLLLPLPLPLLLPLPLPLLLPLELAPELLLVPNPDDDDELLLPFVFAPSVVEELSVLPAQATIVTQDAKNKFDAQKPIFMVFLPPRRAIHCHDDRSVASAHDSNCQPSISRRHGAILNAQERSASG